jgi:hypothetical protein
MACEKGSDHLEAYIHASGIPAAVWRTGSLEQPVLLTLGPSFSILSHRLIRRQAEPGAVWSALGWGDPLFRWAVCLESYLVIFGKSSNRGGMDWQSG